MRTVATRIRTLFIPCTLALIFGILLFQTDRAWMKDGEKQRLSKPSAPQSTATKSAIRHPAFTGSTFNAASASTTSAPNAFFAPAISASKSVNLASASPGATLNYTVTIGNAGADPALGVLFSDTIDPNTTLVPGSVNTSPLALTDTYASIGNVGITVPAVSGVLANDFDPDGTTPAIVAVNTAGTQGTVSLNLANGSFTFNPNPGFEGTTTFTYTLSDGALADTGLVSITVSGMIWFVDDSVAGPGDGRLSAPFNSIANFNSLAADDPGDNIFVYSGNYTGPLTLLASQKLIGQGATASLASIAGISLPPHSNALPATGGTRPVLTNANTNVTVSTGNTIRGVDIQNTTAGSALLGTSFNNLNISETTVSSSNAAAAVNLDQASGTASINVSFITVSANTCTNGIVLRDTTGSFTVTGNSSGLCGGQVTAGSPPTVTAPNTADCTGGTIQSTTGDAIILNNTANVSITRMRILNISGVNNDGIDADEISGSNFFINGHLNNVSSAGSSGSGISIINTNTTLSLFSVENSYFANTLSGTSHVFSSARGTGSMSVDVKNSIFENLVPLAVQINAGDAEDQAHTVTSNITGNVFRNASASDGQGGIAVANAEQAATHNFTVSNNLFEDLIKGIAGGNAEILLAQTTGGALNGTISGNILGTAAAGNGDRRGIGVIAEPDVSANGELGSIDIIIENNTINRLTDREAIFVDIREDTANSELIIRNNSLGNLAGFLGQVGGIREAVDVQVRGETAKTLNLLMTGNNVRSNTSTPTGVVNLEVNNDATTTAANIALQATVTGNTLRADTGGIPTLTVRTRSGDTGGNICLDLNGNTLNSGAGTLQVNEDGGPVNVEQASAAALAAANGIPAGNVIITGTPQFGIACSSPPSGLAGESLTTLVAPQQSGSSGNIAFRQVHNWSGSVFSAFTKSVSFVNLDRAFGKVAEAVMPSASAAVHNYGTESASAMSGETVTKAIAVIPPLKTVTITFSVTIDTPFPPNVCTVTNQGSVSGSNFSTVATNPATTTVLLAPTIGACPTNITTNTDPGLCTAAVTFATPTATGCPTPTVTCSPASGSAFAKGTTTVTCTATNGVSPNSTCSFTVTVNDNQGPTFAGCPTNITTNTDAGLCTAAVTYIAPTATDACDGALTVTCSPASGSNFPKGVTTVTCSASDSSSNSNSCSFTVTVADNQGPVLTACPANISTNTDAGLCTAVATYTAPTANDVCDGTRTVTCSPASGSAFAKGVTTVTCSASDTSGNSSSCTFTVTVADNQGPTVTCPGPISVIEDPVGSGSATATFSATANDVCDGARLVTCTPASGSSFPVGVTTVTCSASDTSGNSGSCSFTVTVSIACTISCPSNVTANTAAGQCAANVSYPAPTTAAGCGTVTCTPASGSSFSVGTTTVTCTTTAGPSCSFTVTVTDNQAPTVTCPANVNAVTDNATGTCSASSVTLGTATAVDNCGGTLTATGTRSDSQPLSAPYPVGVTTITWSATDGAGNTGSCTQTVTVTNPNPVVSITGPASGSIFAVNTPVNFTGSFTDNTGTHTATWTLGATNVAGVVNETLQTVTASYTFTTPGIYSVTLTVNDNCGGTGSTNEIGGIGALVVVYDPNGGFVTGGGWINSPAGAYAPNPSLTGKANFGFNAKYKNNGSLDSQMNFQFKTGNFHFQADDADWLVVTGAKAQFQGTGTVQGSTNSYGFTVTVIDGSVSGGGGVDKFRISIWDITNGNAVVYDTQPGDPINANPTTLLGGGNIVVHNGGNGQGQTKAISDFDGDGKTDLALWDARNGEWQIIRSDNSAELSVMLNGNFDPLNDIIVPGDYDGDGKADAAVFHRFTAQWTIKRSSNGQTTNHLWGVGTDVAVPADYDGDGKTDLAVWRSSEARWHIQRSSDSETQTVEWGLGEPSIADIPVPADYDGDGKADIAVFRRSTGTWHIKSSVDGATIFKAFGFGTDVPVPADYDGDGKADIAVWRGSIGMWFIVNSSNDAAYKVAWGTPSQGDIPAPGDYDGDGKTDIAVWRLSDATWYIKLSLDQSEITKSQGSTSNIPAQAATRR